MKNNKEAYLRGLKDGIPIALGYFVVSFTLGITARVAGITALQSFILSVTNFSSAGEKAAIDVIEADSGYLEMALTMVIINLRYLLMSAALSQKFSPDTPFYHRFFVAFGVTDEIFGISVSRPGYLNPMYSYGAITLTNPAWACGMVLGVVSGNIMPGRLLSAMTIALYGMFLAIIIPQMRENKVIRVIVPLSMILSAAFTLLPGLKLITPGYRVIILTVAISAVAAAFFSHEERNEI